MQITKDKEKKIFIIKINKEKISRKLSNCKRIINNSRDKT